MSRKITITIAVVLLVGIVTYSTGIASQLIYTTLSWLRGEAGLGQGLAGLLSGAITEPESPYAVAPAASLNIGRPRYVFDALINFPYNLYGLSIIVVLAGLVIIFLRRTSSVQGTMDNERNLVYSNKGTYGTAGWMTNDELHKELEVTKDLKRCRGTILGELPGSPGKAVCVPENTMMNRNVAVYGAAGSMKSRAYVRNMVFQCVRRGESLIITDPKSELYASMAKYLRDKGYTVKVFNLISPENSDSWNCLREIEGDNQEFMAQIFCDVVIRNTLLNNRLDPFWDTGAISLLKALCLYVVQVYPEADRNIGEVYKLLANVATGGDGGGLKAAFAALPFGHSAKAPYDIFTQASENVQSGIIIGLANRIQVFQIEVLRTITSHSNGIDLTLPGKEKCAYFCITSDQDSTFDFLSSLFLSFIFIKLVRFADGQPNQALPVPVHVLADELANIGVIPDLTKKISTVRSRRISMSVIFQNIAQMKNRYPDDAWLEIIGNADTQLFLGCTDEMTAKFISDRTGEVTVGVEGTAREMRTMRLSNYIPSQRETASIGKRKLLTPDEVLRLPREDALVIFRGQKVLRVQKFDYTKHPESKKLRDCNARDYVPNWREEEERIRPTVINAEEGLSFVGSDENLSDIPVTPNTPAFSGRSTVSSPEDIQELTEDCVGERRTFTSQEKVIPVEKAVRRKKTKDEPVLTIRPVEAVKAEKPKAENPDPPTAPSTAPIENPISMPVLAQTKKQMQLFENETDAKPPATSNVSGPSSRIKKPSGKKAETKNGGRTPGKKAGAKWIQGEIDISESDEPFRAIDVDNLLDDL